MVLRSTEKNGLDMAYWESDIWAKWSSQWSSKACRSIQKNIPGKSPEVDAFQVYLKSCQEANLAAAKCGEETKGAEVKRQRSGKFASVCRSLKSSDTWGSHWWVCRRVDVICLNILMEPSVSQVGNRMLGTGAGWEQRGQSGGYCSNSEKRFRTRW